MNRQFFLIILFLALAAGNISAQIQLSHQVIGSAGGYAQGPLGRSLSSTIGESVITTLSSGSQFLTQGFHQPSGASVLAVNANATGFRTSCSIAKDGYAVVNVFSGVAPYTYQWFPSGGASDTARNLAAGTYWVRITAGNGFSLTDTVIVAANDSIDCNLHVYSGFSPNNDNKNDFWEIDGISFFPENEVEVFDRWGNRMWRANNYDNNQTVWRGESRFGQDLPNGTYYYVITTSANTYKGWVEITR